MAAKFSRVRESRRANTTSGLRRGLAAVALAGGVAGFATLGMAAVVSSPAGAAPGNNGTVKIQNVGDVDGQPDNNPHVGCTFSVEWFNFDKAATASVSFTMQAPTKGAVTVSGDTSPSFAGGQGLDHVEAYTLTPDPSITPQANQGYHVTLTVHTSASKGNDVKHKTFWFSGCGVVATTPPATTPPATTPPATTPPATTPPATVGIPNGGTPTMPTAVATGPTEGESVATPTTSATAAASPQPGAVVPTRIESGLVSLPTVTPQQRMDRWPLFALSGLSAALGALGLLPRRRSARRS